MPANGMKPVGPVLTRSFAMPNGVPQVAADRNNSVGDLNSVQPYVFAAWPAANKADRAGLSDTNRRISL